MNVHFRPPSPARSIARSDRPRPRRAGVRPAVEPLEGRALMSHAGSYDGSFGASGTVTDPFDPSGVATDIINGQAIQADGKVVVVGQSSSTTDLGLATATTTDFSVARLNPDGTPDATFGNKGVLELFPTQGDFSGFTQASATDVKIQPDGKIVIGGVAGLGVVKVVRLNPDGSFDPSFGAGGVATFGLQLPTGTATANPPQAETGQIALQADGKVVVSAIAHFGTAGGPMNQGDLAAARLTALGALDPTFGAGGQEVFPLAPRPDGTPQPQGPTGVAIQLDGKVVVSASGRAVVNGLYVHEPVLARLGPDGTPDPSFGSGGQLDLPASLVGLAGADFLGSALALQADGKLVVVGSAGGQLAAIRLDARGSPDPSFGGRGFVLVGPSASGDFGTSSSVLVLPGGQILLGGGIRAIATLYRVNPDGSIDRGFGIDGQSVLRSRFLTFVPTALAVQTDGRILVALGNGVDARLLTSGAPGDYDNDGRTDVAIDLPSLGAFAIRPSGGGPDRIIPFGFGGPGGTIPAPGDYDGDGRTDLAAYLPSLGAFAYRPSLGGPDVIAPFGLAGPGRAIPTPGDYSGSGVTELAVYLPELADFAYRPANGGPDVIVPFGFAGSGLTIPAPGDYDGDSRTDLAAYLPTLGAFAIRPSSGGPDRIIPFGLPGIGRSLPVPGDYDGSGKTELAVYLPGLGLLAYRPADGGPDVYIPFGAGGPGGTLPAPGDYSGSGKTEVAAYLPAFGAFAYRPANGGPDVVQSFGIAGPGQSIPLSEVPEPGIAVPTLVAASIDPAPGTTSPPKRKDALAAPASTSS